MEKRKRRLAYLMILPVSLWLLFFIGLPIVDTFRTSLFKTSYKGERFVGLANYFGLTPTCKNSGEQTKRLGGISKEGSKLVRFILGLMVTPVTRRDPWMRSFYRRIKKRRGAKIARVAVMRRLCTVIYRMIEQDAPYIPDGPTAVLAQRELLNSLSVASRQGDNELIPEVMKLPATKENLQKLLMARMHEDERQPEDRRERAPNQCSAGLLEKRSGCERRRKETEEELRHRLLRYQISHETHVSRKVYRYPLVASVLVLLGLGFIERYHGGSGGVGRQDGVPCR